MTPREIHTEFNSLVESGEFLVCGSPGQHTIISLAPLYFRGELEVRDAVVFATPSTLLAMVHTIMRGTWWWEKKYSGKKGSFKVLEPKGSAESPGDGQIHLIPKKSFEQYTALIFASKTNVVPIISVTLRAQETMKFLRKNGVRFSSA